MRQMRWDCLTSGCFRITCPKLGMLDDCFPGKIGMSDIDGAVEVNKHFLFLEWKSYQGDIPTGQKIYFERLTALSDKITAVIVSHDVSPENVTHCQVVSKGKFHEAETCDFAELCSRIKKWSDKAEGLKRD